MAHPTLPDGWRMVFSQEHVPGPPDMQPGTELNFVRPTWNGYNAKGEWVAGSQSETDCYGQLLANYQSRNG